MLYTTPLGSNETLTAPYEDISGYNSISILGQADVAGTLYYDFSSDGLDAADRSVQLSNGLNGNYGIHSLIPVSKYGRLRLVNGASAQATLNLEIMFSDEARIALPTSRAEQAFSDYSDVLNVRNITDNYLDEANSKDVDRFIIQRHGRNPSVTTTLEDIWDDGGIYTGFLTAASTVRIKAGGDANDTAAGTGARSVMVQGLDENWNYAEEVIVTAGASASSVTTTTFIRVNDCFVVGHGTYTGTNTGDIIIESSGGVKLADILTGDGETEMAFYTIPAGFKGFCRNISASVDGSKSATIDLFRRSDADVVAAPFTASRIWYVVAGLSGHAERIFESYPGPFPAKTDIWASAVLSTGTAEVSVSFDLVMVRE